MIPIALYGFETWTLKNRDAFELQRKILRFRNIYKNNSFLFWPHCQGKCGEYQEASSQKANKGMVQFKVVKSHQRTEGIIPKH